MAGIGVSIAVVTGGWETTAADSRATQIGQSVLLIFHSSCCVKRASCENEGVGAIRMKLANLPLLGRFAVVGAGSAGAAGAVAGLTIGLIVYAPTAPFALVELALPSAVVGGLAGLAAGAGVAVVRKMRR